MAQLAAESNQPKRPSPRLSHPSDANELRWYFAQGGLTVFWTCTFGAQLERASMIAYGGAACKRCTGSGFIATKAKPWHYCDEGQRAVLALLVGLEASELEPPLGDQVCGVCKGMGWIPNTRRTHARGELTARPRWKGGGSKKGRSGGIEVADTSIARLGAITTRLSQLTIWDASVLEAYYSPAGRSIVALYSFTPAGKTLLRRNSQNVLPKLFFENEIKRQEEKRDERRGSLLDAAEEQAVEVHRASVGAWCMTRHRVDREQTQAAALRLLDG